MRRAWLALSVGMLCSCATGSGQKGPTLADLANRAVPLERQRMADVTVGDVQQSYATLAATTQNQGIKVIAMERIADLALDEKEALQGDAAKREAVAVVDGDDVDYREVIRQYERLLELYPDYVGNDRVLYQLAKSYDLSGDLEHSLEAMNRLMTKYPNNPFAEEIQFRRGELLFALRDYPGAQEAYAAILKIGVTSTFYDRALYKHGWAQFKRADLDVAASAGSFFNLLDRGYEKRSDSEEFTRKETDLLEDALRALSLAFSLQKGPESIAEHFDAHGHKDYEFRVYQRLAELYLSQQRNDDAANTYRAFVAEAPLHAQAPYFMLQMMDIYRLAGQSQNLLSAQADFVTYYGVKTAFWADKEPLLLETITPYLKANIQELARHAHAQAQKTKAQNNYAIAGHWYRTYVDSFPTDTAAPGMNFMLAEVLYETGTNGAAAREYERTAYDYPLHEKSAAAGYAALIAHRKLIDELVDDARQQQRGVAVVSAKRFAETFPQDPQVPAVLTKAAEEQLDLLQYADAVVSASQVIAIRPEATLEQRRIAWAIIAKSEFELGAYRRAENASLQRLQLAAPDDPDHDVHVERLAAAIYKQGEEARDGGRLDEAAEHFLRVVTLAPTATIRAGAEYDAAAAYVAGNNWKAAIPVLDEFIKRYPENPLRVGATEKLALAYEQSGDWARAAAQYTALFEQEPDQERRRALLWQTAELFEKSGDKPKAIGAYQRFAVTFGEPLEQAMEARNKVATFYKELNDADNRRRSLEQLVAAHHGDGVTLRTRFLAATAALELAEPSYAAFTKVKLTQPLKENLKKKKDLMQTGIAVYTQAAEYGIAEVTTACFYRIGHMYQEFSHDLLSSERPKDLAEDELEQYQVLLEEQAYPFEEKAIEVHEANVRTVFQGVYDDWVKRSFTALSQLNPLRYAKAERMEEQVNVIE